eukprot:TRINITY_DN14365_c0_g1_i1.p1 TRINITY_DN14365_c0_g1~~TRINITY_DN14365_c0_g1_i1.p1  ORF type:complete len:478 (+),score=121.17 TRINITY_DN14365_c0_g1_i1:93-1436(+)
MSPTTLKRKEAALRSLYFLFHIEDMISLGAGMPNPVTFPIKKITFALQPLGSTETIDIVIDETKLKNEAFQYTSCPGIPGLRKWLQNLQALIHKPVYPFSATDPLSWDVQVISGSQEGLAKIASALLSENDSVLVESAVYSSMKNILEPLGVRLIPMPIDGDGIIPEELKKILQKEKQDLQDGKVPRLPKFLYTVPTCNNPAGVNISLKRKEEIYNLACEYDLLIVEDDPYYFLQFDSLTSKSEQSEPADELTSMASSYIPGIFHFDHEGRVIRLDSFSKVGFAGARVGWLTAPKILIQKYELLQQIDSVHASGIAQVILEKMFDFWGFEGFLKHVRSTAAWYKERRDLMCTILNEEKFDGIEWEEPKGGFFLWLKTPLKDTTYLLKKYGVDRKILFISGTEFDVAGDSAQYIRLSFSIVTEEAMRKGIQRLMKLLKDECEELGLLK